MRAVKDYRNRAEARADRDRVIEQALNDFGTRIGCDVVVLGGKAEDFVAHASTGEKGLKARLAQAAHDMARAGFEIGRRGFHQ